MGGIDFQGDWLWGLTMSIVYELLCSGAYPTEYDFLLQGLLSVEIMLRVCAAYGAKWVVLCYALKPLSWYGGSCIPMEGF